jgi:hypothetical protein
VKGKLFSSFDESNYFDNGSFIFASVNAEAFVAVQEYDATEAT